MKPSTKAPVTWLTHLLTGVLRFYRFFISPFLGNNCRFVPSCSNYAETAIKTYGPLKGSWLAIKRLSKCHPWHEGGLDPVPTPTSNQTQPPK